MFYISENNRLFGWSHKYEQSWIHETKWQITVKWIMQLYEYYSIYVLDKEI